MNRIVWIEMRRSLLLWVLPPVTVLWLGLVLVNADAWVGSWQAAVTYTASGAAYALVPLAAVAGHDAARRAASGLNTYARLATRHRVLAIAPRHLAATLLLLGAGLVVTLVVAARSSAAGPGAFDSWDQVVYCCAAVTLAVCLASVAGSLAPSALAGALWGLVIGGVMSYFGDIPLLPTPDVQIDRGRLVLCCAVALVAAAASVVAPAVGVQASPESATHRWLTAATALVIVVCLAMVTGASALAGPLRSARPGPAMPACSAGRPAVCVWPDHSSYLPALTRMRDRARQAHASALAMPTEFSELGVRHGRDATYSFQVTSRSDRDLWQTAGGMASTVVNRTLVPTYCEPSSQSGAEHAATLQGNLHYWLQVRIFGGQRPAAVPDVVQARHILAQPDAQQKAWANRTVAQIRAVPCAGPGRS